MRLSPIKQSLVDAVPKGVRRVLVAVSGGVDSVVLLHLLKGVATELELTLEVAHLDHQIRPESVADATFVKNFCGDLNIPCHIENCDVVALAGAGRLSLEMAGRQARREFLGRIAGTVGADLVALAHHRDDQVETFLLRLVRGSGLSGLSAMRGQTGSWWRPLLNCSREQILGYAKGEKLGWVEDKSNRDSAFLRNRFRGQIVPLLRDINPKFDDRIATLTQQVQLEEDYWHQQVAQNFPPLIVSSHDGLRLDRPALLKIHPALRLRLLREALRQVRGNLQKIEAVHLRAVEGLVVNQRSQAQLDLPDSWVARRYETIWFKAVAPELSTPFDLPLTIPGEIELPDGRMLHLSLQDEQGGESLHASEFSATELSQPLRVRSWMPGDRFAPQGMTGRKRLKRFFSDNQVELEERHRLPILICGEEILWLVGMRRSGQANANRDGGAILRVELF